MGMQNILGMHIFPICFELSCLTTPLSTGATRIFVDHNTRTTTWDDPRMPSSVYAGAPQSKRDYRRKVFYFRSQPTMRTTTEAKCGLRVRRGMVFEDILLRF